jgi:hypothetical protein
MHATDSPERAARWRVPARAATGDPAPLPRAEQAIDARATPAMLTRSSS